METPCYIINSFIFIKGKSQKFTGDIFQQISIFKFWSSKENPTPQRVRFKIYTKFKY